MKIKAAPKTHKVMVELESQDKGLPLSLPFHLQRLLVPMDFSDTAKKALQYAVPFAAAFDAEVVLLHVLQPYTLPADLGYLPPELAISEREILSSAREELTRLCVREISARARCRAEVRQGLPWQEIVATARETNTDLIVLATHGRTGVQHVLLGSVTERVVRHAPCPVLVVRELERDFATARPHSDAPPDAANPQVPG
jgi:nucleotide-binding universal stress UspA family protein